MLDKLYYTIAEVSEELGVTQPTLRFWEKEFNRLSPHRSSKGQRKYTKDDVLFLKKLIFLTKDCGYTLEGAKRVMRTQNATRTEAQAELAFALNEIKDFLLEMKKNLKASDISEVNTENENQ